METKQLKSRPEAEPSKKKDAGALPKGQVLEDRYYIVEKLGSGGVGDVYRAQHLRLDREVAVKVLQPQYAASPKLKARFEREAHALANMAHPNIVTVNDYGVAGDMPYLVMEILRGQALSKKVARGALDPRRALDVARQVLQALAFAHDQGWVHRDLKPGNIFLRELAGGSVHASILDFGLAKLVTSDGRTKGPRLTLTGMVFGTPAYMAPEQAVGSETDARTDLYSAAVVTYEMLTGRRLFLGSSDKLMRQHLQAEPPSVLEGSGDRTACPELEELLQKALAKERGDRFQTADEMIAAIDALPSPAVIVDPERNTQPVDATGKTALDLTGEGQTRNTAPTVNETPPPGAPAAPEPKLPSFATGMAALIGLILGVAIAAPITYVVMENTDLPRGEVPGAPELPGGGAAPAPALGGPTPAPPVKTPAKAAAVPARPAAVVSPWDSPEVPAIVARARRALAKGNPLPRDLYLKLRQHAVRNNDDPRAFLLLGRHHIARRALTDGMARYERAHAVDANARHDPWMKRDLIELLQNRTVGNKAAQLVETIYGREALDEVEASLRAPELDSKARRRLVQLRSKLRALPATSSQ